MEMAGVGGGDESTPAKRETHSNQPPSTAAYRTVLALRRPSPPLRGPVCESVYEFSGDDDRANGVNGSRGLEEAREVQICQLPVFWAVS